MRSLFQSRTSQGSVAWGISLITFPYAAVPLYLLFGGSRFQGYAEALRAVEVPDDARREEIVGALESFFCPLPPHFRAAEKVFETLADFGFTHSNAIEVHTDGREFFDALFAEISRAQHCVLIGYYIVRDDEIGRALCDVLIKKAREGVAIYFLYDAVGSHFLSRSYIDRLREGGVDVQAFYSTKSIFSIFQINFRNHRKIAVIDGETAFVGGHNIGVEYLTQSPRHGEWRDTSIRIRGPAVVNVQHIFRGDWIWSTGKRLELNWSVKAVPGGEITALAVGTGPVEGPESCSLLFLQLIGMATKRLWIANPYFVPDEAVTKALQLAAARGVDVRILLPAKADNLLVHLASFSYVRECINCGISLLRFTPGFLHQKVMLVDDQWTCVGTANMDNRSLRLNFEISVVSLSESFAERIRSMFEEDFARSAAICLDDYEKKPLPIKVAVGVSRLFAPIL